MNASSTTEKAKPQENAGAKEAGGGQKADAPEQPKPTSKWREFLNAKNDLLEPIEVKELSFSSSLKLQTARATVGEGEIIVRNAPDTSLAGLNRDLDKALTVTTNHDIDVNLAPIMPG